MGMSLQRLQRRVQDYVIQVEQQKHGGQYMGGRCKLATLSLPVQGFTRGGEVAQSRREQEGAKSLRGPARHFKERPSQLPGIQVLIAAPLDHQLGQSLQWRQVERVALINVEPAQVPAGSQRAQIEGGLPDDLLHACDVEHLEHRAEREGAEPRVGQVSALAQVEVQQATEVAEGLQAGDLGDVDGELGELGEVSQRLQGVDVNDPSQVQLPQAGEGAQRSDVGDSQVVAEVQGSQPGARAERRQV